MSLALSAVGAWVTVLGQRRGWWGWDAWFAWAVLFAGAAASTAQRAARWGMLRKALEEASAARAVELVVLRELAVTAKLAQLYTLALFGAVQGDRPQTAAVQGVLRRAVEIQRKKDGEK